MLCRVRLLKKGDILVILSVLLLEAVLAIVFFGSAFQGDRVVVELNNELLYDFSLLSNETLEIRGNIGKVTVAVENGRARFTEAECPDHICVKTGWISKTGQAAACVPNGVLIRISGSGGGDAPDVVLK